MNINPEICKDARYGTWTVVEPFSDVRRMAICKCDCGTVRTIPRGNLTAGVTKRCQECRFAEAENKDKYFKRVWQNKGLCKSDWKDYFHFQEWAKKECKEGFVLRRKNARKPHGPENSVYIKNKRTVAIEAIAQCNGTSVEEVSKWASTVSRQRLYGLYNEVLEGRGPVLNVGRPQMDVSEVPSQLIKKLIESGMSQSAIARTTGRDSRTIKRWCELLGVSPAPGLRGRPPKNRKAK